ncbi:MAG: hypothetical protein P1U61_03250 [Legionellaceae bacterium]|nr:hypothetical protein [Legionellaceae bacterium]
MSKKKLTLRKSYFSKNHHRENEGPDIFNIVYRSLSFITNIVFPIIFTPAIIISNLISHNIFFSLLNISLALGYCTQFLNRIILKEMGLLELITSFMTTSIIIALSFYAYPILGSLTLINTFNVINLLATSINSFFLIRNYFLIPLQSLLQKALHMLGIETSITFFYKENLSIIKDRPVLDRLLQKFYDHDSFDEHFLNDEITPFNNLLQMMVRYVNKYHEPFLGALNNQDKINHLKKAIDQLVLDGNTDSSLSFINKKLAFKKSKVKLLKAAIKTIEEEKSIDSFNPHNIHCFFNQPLQLSHQEIVATGHSLLEKELKRQQEKINDLESCVPGVCL